MIVIVEFCAAIEKLLYTILKIGQSRDRYYSMITLERLYMRQAILGFIKWVIEFEVQLKK